MIKINFSNIHKPRFHIIIVVLVFCIYGNSINNEYSLDDNIVVDGVAKVEKGIKGIPEIFTTHYDDGKEQSYGYRPIVTSSFAIEKHFFNKLPPSQTIKEKKQKDKLTQANISHFINVVLYALTGIILFNFLTLLFKDYNLVLPFLVTVFFIIHPLHTEPVCNIKSRDELFLFIATILALRYYLKFGLTSNYKYLAYALLFVLCAFLSKKSAIILLGATPVVLYFANVNYKKILFSTASILIGIIIILAMRRGLISAQAFRNVKYFENPLISEGGFMDRITVGLYCSWFYLKMLIFPKDMAYYYGFNVIPMANWSFYQVWLALIFYIPLSLYGFWRLIKKDVLGLGIILWIGIMLAFINTLYPVVGIVAERFTYTFSLGFCIVISILLLRIFKINLDKDLLQVKLSKGFVTAFLLISITYSARVIARNPNWHDRLTLYYHDIEVVDESAKCHAFLAQTLSNKIRNDQKNAKNNIYIQEIIKHYKRAIEIDTTYLTSYNNLGSTYISALKDNESGIYYCQKAFAIDSVDLVANFNLAIAYDRSNDPKNALKHYLKVIETDPTYASIYNHLNKLLIKTNKVQYGIDLLNRIAQNTKNPKEIYINIANLHGSDLSKINIALSYFIKAFNVDKNDKILCQHIASLYDHQGNVAQANRYMNIYNSITTNPNSQNKANR